MDAIINYDKKFNYDELYFTAPSSMNGGNYFIKIINNTTPLYIQPPKCILKNGIMKSGKRWYCDLMFTRSDGKFIEWIENLENVCHGKIYENRSKWFETNLEEDDIENSFTPPFKLYKSGSFYILRASIPNILDKPNIKIYNEDGCEISINDVKSNDNIASIIEIQGIKCSVRSFSLEFLIKQMLIIKSVDDIFNKPILINNKISNNNNTNNNKQIETASVETAPVETASVETASVETAPVETTSVETAPVETTSVETASVDNKNNLEKTLQDNKTQEFSKMHKDTLNINTDTIYNELQKKDVDNLIKFRELDANVCDLVEIDVKPTDEDKIFLKEKNDIYYNMYREALQKAKIAKKIALTKYLEAKRIKNTYMLTDISDDSDIDDTSIHSDEEFE